MRYSREAPSARYVELLDLYREMHQQGDQEHNLPPEQTFSGISLQPHVQALGGLIKQFGVRSVLDYGCGKAEAYSTAQFQLSDGRRGTGLKALWEVDDIALYDPGYAPYSELPTGRFDAVICTDVLEHCPEEDVDWILGEILGFAQEFAFLTVAVYPAKKTLPNGDNAHVTIKSAGWWLDKMEKAAAGSPDVKYFLVIIHAGGRKTLVEG